MNHVRMFDFEIFNNYGHQTHATTHFKHYMIVNEWMSETTESIRCCEMKIVFFRFSKNANSLKISIKKSLSCHWPNATQCTDLEYNLNWATIGIKREAELWTFIYLAFLCRFDFLSFEKYLRWVRSIRMRRENKWSCLWINILHWLGAYLHAYQFVTSISKRIEMK